MVVGRGGISVFRLLPLSGCLLISVLLTLFHLTGFGSCSSLLSSPSPVPHYPTHPHPPPPSPPSPFPPVFIFLPERMPDHLALIYFSRWEDLQKMKKGSRQRGRREANSVMETVCKREERGREKQDCQYLNTARAQD